MSKTTLSVDPLVYTIPEVAELLRVSTRQMYNIARQDGFPVARISPNRVIVPKAALEAWLEQQIGNQ